MGEACVSDGECASGLCFSECLAPDADADADGITNAVVVHFGKNPLSADSDGDGKPDGDEYGAARTTLDSPPDIDADDRIDALDSAIIDNPD